VPAARAAPWVLAAVAPVAVPVALARDRADGDARWWRIRADAMARADALAESAGLTACALLWAAPGPADTGTPRSRRWHHALQRAWLAAIRGSARGLLGLRFDVAGLDALDRDASDALLPVDLFVVRSGRPPRMVVKDDLEWIPCRDAAPGADVAILDHVGLEQVSSMARLARSLPFRRPVRAQLWLVPRSEIPVDAEVGPRGTREAVA
jgi:hypothetical protein